MDFMLTLLAQVEPEIPLEPVPQAPPAEPVPDAFFPEVPIKDIWDYISAFSWQNAVGFIAFGMVYLLYGWRLYKLLVVTNFALIGLFGGVFLGRQLGSAMWGGILGCFIIGSVSRPFMRYSVSLLGATAGAILGAALWRTLTLPDPLIWCGGLAGLVAGGFLAFSSFSLSVMLFSSLQGSAALVVGVLALLSEYPNLEDHISRLVYNQEFFLPVMLLIPSLLGIILQGRLHKGNSAWKLPNGNQS